MNPADQLKFDKESNTLHIEEFPGIVYTIAGKEVSGNIKLTRNTIVRARERGRKIDAGSERQWTFKVSESTEAVKSEESKESQVGDTPPAATAGNTPQAPQQATGIGPAGGNVPPTSGPRPPRP